MGTRLKGVLLTPLKRVPHPKGDIRHALKRSSAGFVDFGEAYFSEIISGEVKGWKRHKTATLNLVVPVGCIKFVVHDDRPNSSSRGNFEEIVLGAENYSRLTIVPGLWVAFSGVGNGENVLLNISSEEHNPDEADNLPLESFSYSW